MQAMSENWLGNITSLARMNKGKVELYKSSALSNTFLPADSLSSIQIEKTPTNGSFFGYSICQKATVNLIDINEEIDISNGDELKIFLGVEGEYASHPTFKVTEVKRDEVKKIITVIAYDLIDTAASHRQGELTITYPITLSGYADAVAAFLGTTVKWDSTPFVDIEFDGATNTPNFSGEETLRDVLTEIAAAAGAICYIDSENKICFKQFTANATPAGNIDKSLYFELTLGEPVTLTKITSVTELGENVSHGTDEGFNQIIRENSFISNHSEIGSIIIQLTEALAGTTFYPYNIKWRGNPAFEIGDCITIERNEGNINMFYLGETINYAGGLKATSEWKAVEQGLVFSNPATLGETIKQTYAKVDKVNKQIDMVVSEVGGYTESISQLQLNTEAITASVQQIQTNMNNELETVNQNIETIAQKVETTVSAEDVAIEVQKQMSDGVNSVTTTTGFTFNEDGLTVSKSDSAITTQITEDGMTVNKAGEAVLVADNVGVKATNLVANTYLIIGGRSRFEDYDLNGEPRTGCFWIGS